METIGRADLQEQRCEDLAARCPEMSETLGRPLKLLHHVNGKNYRTCEAFCVWEHHPLNPELS